MANASLDDSHQADTYRRIELFTGNAKRRIWTAEEKGNCAQIIAAAEDEKLRAFEENGPGAELADSSGVYFSTSFPAGGCSISGTPFAPMKTATNRAGVSPSFRPRCQ